MITKFKKRRIIASLVAILSTLALIFLNPASYTMIFQPDDTKAETSNSGELGEGGSDNGGESGEGGDSNGGATVSDPNDKRPLATDVLSKLDIKGRAPKTGYARSEFYDSWPIENGCNLRQRILKRDFGDTAVLDEKNNCTVISGSFYEPYTGQFMTFTERTQISKGVQIDHVVALSDAWQKGAQYKTKDERFAMATDPLNLIAVDSSANQQKSDGDAATWLPKNKSFRCQYVARQISVKYKYTLWVTQAEKDAMVNILKNCPDERAVGVEI
jgi:hypothetical protein